MKKLLYLFLIAFFAVGVCIPAFACDSGDGEKGEEWRKYLDSDEGDDPSEKADAEWKKALKKDDDDPSEKADAPWRKAMLEDK